MNLPKTPVGCANINSFRIFFSDKANDGDSVMRKRNGIPNVKLILDQKDVKVTNSGNLMSDLVMKSFEVMVSHFLDNQIHI